MQTDRTWNDVRPQPIDRTYGYLVGEARIYTAHVYSHGAQSGVLPGLDENTWLRDHWNTLENGAWMAWFLASVGFLRPVVRETCALIRTLLPTMTASERNVLGAMEWWLAGKGLRSDVWRSADPNQCVACMPNLSPVFMALAYSVAIGGGNGSPRVGPRRGCPACDPNGAQIIQRQPYYSCAAGAVHATITELAKAIDDESVYALMADAIRYSVEWNDVVAAMPELYKFGTSVAVGPTREYGFDAKYEAQLVMEDR